MLIFGIILMVVGIVIFQWTIAGVTKSVFDRPMIFNKPIAVSVFHILWAGFLLGGMYILWLVNPVIVFVLIGIFIVLWAFGYFINSEKTKAKRIFKIYKQLKLFRPQMSGEDIFRETALTYYRGLRWDEAKIQMTLEYVLKDDSEKDIKDIARSILSFENIDAGFHDPRNAMEKHFKRSEIVEAAYESVIGNKSGLAERPELSKFALEWIQSAGLNPDEMSNEQLQVFTEMDDHSKSNFIVKGFYGAATIFLFLAIFALFTLDIWGIVTYLFLSFILWFVGNKIQVRRISKKFYEASIAKYAQEKTQKQNNHVTQ